MCLLAIGPTGDANEKCQWRPTLGAAGKHQQQGERRQMLLGVRSHLTRELQTAQWLAVRTARQAPERPGDRQGNGQGYF